ncbi:MAG: DUF4373 domain-containing protein [Eubacteriaceae bacterium]|nr:DUF4373 domain-containing protein [Eubacteriaceae bacterium]
MARPKKEALDYFPLDCADSTPVNLVTAKYGPPGYYVYIKLHQKIFGEKGYYLEWNDDVKILFAREININPSLLQDVLTELLNRGIFNSTLFTKHSVLTSELIQKIYIDATSKRTKVSIRKDYMLINTIDNPIPSHITIT